MYESNDRVETQEVVVVVVDAPITVELNPVQEGVPVDAAVGTQEVDAPVLDTAVEASPVQETVPVDPAPEFPNEDAEYEEEEDCTMVRVSVLELELEELGVERG